MRTGFVKRMRHTHNDSGLLMLSKSLKGILRSEGRSFLNDSVAEDLVSRVSLRCAAKNLHSIADILRRGKLDDFCDDHLEIIWLVSCSMECYKLFSRSTLDALLRTAFIAILHEVRITGSMLKTREFNRSICYFNDVFPDVRIDHEKLQLFRDRAVSTIRHVSKLFRESRNRAALSLATHHEKKTSWPGLVAVLRKEAKRLGIEYSALSGGVIPAEVNREKKLKNGSRSRHERMVEKDYAYQDDDEYSEDLLAPGEVAYNDLEDQDIYLLDHHDYGHEGPSRNIERRQPRAGQLRGRDQHSRSKARSRKKSAGARGYHIDYEEEEVGSVRHGPKPDKLVPQNDDDSVALGFGGLESQDFPSAVVSSKTDDAQIEKERADDRESVEESSDEHMLIVDADFGGSVTLSDQIQQAKLENKEVCVQELHKASTALDKLGPQDPLDEISEDRKVLDRKVRARRTHGLKRSPREASPIPDSEGVQVMKRRRRNVGTLQKTPVQPRRGQKYEPVLKVKRGRFTPREDEWLIEGIRKHGWGSWKEIVNEFFEDGEFTRLAMSLKDRARTLGLNPDKYPRRTGVRGRPRSKFRERVGEQEIEEIEDDGEE